MLHPLSGKVNDSEASSFHCVIMGCCNISVTPSRNARVGFTSVNRCLELSIKSIDFCD